MEKAAESQKLTQLITQAAAGSRSAFAELYDATAAHVSQTVHFLLGEKSDVEDVIQEIYIQLHKSLPKYDTARPFRPWLTGLAIRQVSAYRRKKWMQFRLLEKSSRYKAEALEPDFSGRLAEDIANQELLQEIEKLPYKLKQVIILHYLHDYSQEETAAILDIPLGTVKSRTHSALQKLRGKQKNSVHFIRKAADQREC